MAGPVVALLLALLGPATGNLAAQATVTGRWHVRLYTGTDIRRGDLRLERHGDVLQGSLALESSDDPPVAVANGRIDTPGQFTFSIDDPESMRFTGRVEADKLVGRVALERGRIWQWTAQRVPPGAEFYAALPRFRAAQLILGRNFTDIPLPGAWVAAADSIDGAGAQAAELSERAGLVPIPADSIRAYGFLPALGVVRRDDLVPAMERALDTIRAALPRSELAQFDALFRPAQGWIVDLHSAALWTAQRKFRNASWADALPALAAADLLPQNLPPGTALIPLALYRLAVLRDRDNAAFEVMRGRWQRGGSASAQITEALLDSYRVAAVWQGEAVAFLLSADWVRTGDGQRSLVDLVRQAWGVDTLVAPAIRARYFGYPEALPSVGMPAGIVGRIVVPENWAAGQWAANRGPAGVLDVFRHLNLAIGANTTLEADGPTRLTSVTEEAAASPAGFLEPTDIIIEDPGAPPLFALATTIHEWQHLLMERHRLSLDPGGMMQPDGVGLRVVASDLFLAEGFAGWMAERILRPALVELPIIGVGDAQKLQVLGIDNRNDPHVLGLHMLQALAAAMGNPAAVRAALLAHGDDPGRVADAVPAWRGSDLPARVVPAHGQRRLIPETEFTVEDGVGDVLAVRIRVLAEPPAGR